MPTLPPFTPEEQRAFEEFGDAWTRLSTVEQAIRSGEGPTFTHHDARQNMHAAAHALRRAILESAQSHPPQPGEAESRP